MSTFTAMFYNISELSMMLKVMVCTGIGIAALVVGVVVLKIWKGRQMKNNKIRYNCLSQRKKQLDCNTDYESTLSLQGADNSLLFLCSSLVTQLMTKHEDRTELKLEKVTVVSSRSDSTYS